MNAQTEYFSLEGIAGTLECALDLPANATPRGFALVAHPHPLYGGTMDNKVVHTLVRSFVTLGYACLLYTSPSPRDVEESRMPSSA